MADADKDVKSSRRDEKRTEEARQVVQEDIEAQRALIEKLQRKMN